MHSFTMYSELIHYHNNKPLLHVFILGPKFPWTSSCHGRWRSMKQVNGYHHIIAPTHLPVSKLSHLCKSNYNGTGKCTSSTLKPGQGHEGRVQVHNPV